MKSKYIHSILMLAVASILGLAFTVDKLNLENIKQKLKFYTINHPLESVYLHLDKPIYKPGDYIWFSAYHISGAKNQPATTNEAILVELYDPKGVKISEFIKSSYAGKMNGNFTLDRNASGGIYTIKAYAESMEAYGEEAYFTKKIPVQKYIKPQLLLKLKFGKEAYGSGDMVDATIKIRNLEDQPLVLFPFRYQIKLSGETYLESTAETNSEGESEIRFQLPDSLNDTDGLVNIMVSYEKKNESIARSIPIVLNNIQLDFFPEGGYLIEGIKTQTAFKALNEFGRPADISGNIYDDNNKLITSFSSFHDGMGAFELQPAGNTRYYAKITKPKGIAAQYKLPIVVETGYVVYNVASSNNQLQFNCYAPVGELAKVAVQIGDEIYYENNIDDHELLRIPTNKWPRGIARITLFDTQLTPQSERLVFINYNQGLQMKVTPNRKKYTPREQVELDITTLDGEGKPIAANVSLAVVSDKVISLADDKQDNILSWFLLSSGVKGDIHEPNFYFDPEEEDAQEAIDYLLMTQAWRRFGWKEVLNANETAKNQKEVVELISGQVIDRLTSKGVKATVQVIEQGAKKRGLEFETNEQGEFMVMGSNPAASLNIYAFSKHYKNRNLRIKLNPVTRTSSAQLRSLPTLNGTAVPETIIIPPKPVQTKKETSEDISGKSTLNLSMVEDLTELEQIVVIGYGSQKKKELTGSVNTVSSEELVQIRGLSSALQGQVAGISVIENRNSIQAPADIKVRAFSNTSHCGPTFFIDGELYDPAISGTINSWELLSGNNINSVDVLKNSSSSLYGNMSPNGAILTNTKEPEPRQWSFNLNRYHAYYHVAPRRQQSWSRYFYSPNYNNRYYSKTRNDFRETVYWAPNITTNSSGKATVSYYGSDEVSTFRIITEGFTKSGEIGRSEETYYTQKSLNINVKLPQFIMVGDTIRANVILKNNSWRTIESELICKSSSNLRLIGFRSKLLQLKPNQTMVIPIQILATEASPSASVFLEFGDLYNKDQLRKRLEIYRTGFPVEVSVSGKQARMHQQFRISKPVKGTLQAEFKAYPSVLQNLLDGIESILKEPRGCFEQTSSSTYPNIMVLQYLRSTNTTNSQVESKAMNYIKQGYRRLTGFETSTGGFDWFGRSPGHLGLTAYGLVEFSDMKKVYPGVSDNMIDRTMQWIMNRRDGEGNFIRSNSGYTFSGNGQEVSNAYVLYALSESGLSYETCKTEMDHAVREVQKDNDSYRLGLLANAAYNFKQYETASTLMNLIHYQLKRSSPGSLNTTSTITYSSGKSAQVETSALLLMALLKEEKKDDEKIRALANYLAESRSHGSFGSTQATVLALKALIMTYAQEEGKGTEGALQLKINNQIIHQQRYVMGKSGAIHLEQLSEYLIEGNNLVQIQIDNDSALIPFSLDVKWKTLTPPSDDACPLKLHTQVEKARAMETETVRMTTELSNRINNDLPMPMAIIGIPGGLSPQMWQLKEMQEKQVFSYYEIEKNHLILYFTGISALEKKVIKLDLKAEVPGYYQAPASCAYLYYTAEHKKWIDGTSINIE